MKPLYKEKQMIWQFVETFHSNITITYYNSREKGQKLLLWWVTSKRENRQKISRLLYVFTMYKEKESK